MIFDNVSLACVDLRYFNGLLGGEGKFDQKTTVMDIKKQRLNVSLAPHIMQSKFRATFGQW